nr:hypothetical protein [Tanacetum cinerariifolium]
MHKSKLFEIAVDHEKVYRAANKIRRLTFKTPFSYLGIKIGGLMSRINSWDEIVNKLLARLSNWKIKTLSIRLTLLKSVLGSTPIFYLSLFKVPIQVLNRMESIRCRFFNGAEPFDKKMTWVKWSRVLAPKEKGGLGARVIKAVHGDDGNIGKQSKFSHPSIWMDIVREMAKLKHQGIDLLGFIKKKKILVAEKLAHAHFGCSLHRILRNGVENSQFTELAAVLEGFQLPVMQDRCAWLLVGSGDFSVTSVRSLNALPTRLNLSRRGLDLQSILCPSCGKFAKSTNHVFFVCPMTSDIFHKIITWWDVGFLELSSYEDWLFWLLNLHIPLKLKEMLEGVFYVM